MRLGLGAGLRLRLARIIVHFGGRPSPTPASRVGRTSTAEPTFLREDWEMRLMEEAMERGIEFVVDELVKEIENEA